MDLNEYRELNKQYFHKDTFAISAEEDKDKVSDDAILDSITRENPEIGQTIVGFILQDRYFLWNSMYPTVKDDDVKVVSEKVERHLESALKEEKDALPILKTLFRENRDKIDFRRLLLNTVVSMQGAIEYAKQGKAPKAAIDKMEQRRDRITEKVRKFRPSVEDPEIYMITPPIDSSKSVAEFVYINWDERIEKKPPKRVPDLGLTSQELKDVESILSLEDTRLIPDSWECGKHVETYLALSLDKAETMGNQIRSDDAYAIVKSILRRPEYQRIIAPEKYHFLALYRALEFIESYEEAELEKFIEIPDKTSILLLAKKLKGLVEKDSKDGRKIDEPFTVFMDDQRFHSKYQYDSEYLMDKGTAGKIDKISLDDLKNYYDGITIEYMDRIVKSYPLAPIDLYQKKLISKVDFSEYIKAAGEKNYVLLINKAYDKKLLDQKEVGAILYTPGNRDEEALRKMGIAEIKFIMPRVQSAAYKDNVVLDEMILSGVVNQDLLIEQYLNGMLKIEDLTNFARYMEESEAIKGQVDCSKLKFNPETLAQVYVQLNLKGVINALANKAHWDKETIHEILKDYPGLVRDCTPEQMEEFKKTFFMQKSLLNNLSDKEQRQFMESLGFIGEAPGIAFDLYSKGIISKHVAHQYGGSKFMDQWNKTQLTDGLRYNDLASIQNLLNAYKHGRISLSKILRKYAEGALEPKIYFAFKEGRDMTGAIDKQYLNSLFDKYFKTGKPEVLEILERYYQEFKDIVTDEKDIAEINKKQQELIAKKNNKLNVVTMARKGIIDKENIAVMDLETIAELIMSGNTLSRETAKKLFRDIDGTTTKRDKLEELFKLEILTQDEMFSILSSVYLRNEESTPEQKEIDENNMAYFMEKEYFESQYGEMGFKGDPTRHNKKGVGVIKNEQQRFPIKQRIEFLYSLDSKDAINYKAGPAIIIQLPGKNKVIIETFGTPGKSGAKTESDLTNHCTYIVDRDVFEDIKSDIFEEKVAMTKKRRKEIESILMYRKLIDMYNEHGKELGMKRFRHNQYWEKSLLKYFEEPEVKEQKEVNKDDRDIDD